MVTDRKVYITNIFTLKMGIKQIRRSIVNYFDLSSSINGRVTETSPEEALVKVCELEDEIKVLTEKRAEYSLLGKIVAYFDLNEPSVSSLQRKRDFYQKLYNLRK